jgi:hypothetical protein
MGLMVGQQSAYGRAEPADQVGGLIGLALAGATVLGGTVLADSDPSLIGGAEALASGAVLAVVSVSIIPYAFAE